MMLSIFLTRSDATCIICCEKMVTAKKLICGHLFHVSCHQSWLERKHTCPTCRTLVVPTENGSTATGGQQRSQSVEDRVLRTAGALLVANQVETMWETAVAKTTSLLYYFCC